ncbi:MAG: zinc carboxypeptidase [Saprospiraceae bacterium]|nr:zinc carboxypeptidase [Saprospiraceae bacterium]
MKRLILSIIFFLTCLGHQIFSQTLSSPESFLGYNLGDKFTYHHEVLRYFETVDAQSDFVKLERYGSSVEGRPLLVAYVSSPANLNRLEEIRKSNIAKTGLTKEPQLSDQPVIVWLSYNIHGNEAVSSETAMKTLHELVANATGKYKEWLDKVVVVIDPCLNPDGHVRYVQFYTQRMSNKPNVNLNTWEHAEPWPGGRPNHYLFDLNRDWAWQTQKESKERIVILNSWMPHVHIDFHEMGINSPYYFAPSAAPIHEDVTEWQRNFQEITGQNVGKYFDANSWLYYKGEVFDLFYPSYGDTYPTFNGSVGMTYEQGGSYAAGLAGINAEGDTVTLKSRIEHHHVAGLASIEAAVRERDKLITEFENYFKRSLSNPPGKYKSYVVKENNMAKRKRLLEYLDRNGIQYGFGSGTPKAKAFSYSIGRDLSFEVGDEDILIPGKQSKAILVKVIFEPQTTIVDSVTYDITAWSLPYAWGLDAYASETALIAKSTQLKEKTKTPESTSAAPVAYIFEWSDIADVQLLSAFLQKGFKPRVSGKAFTLEGRDYKPGTLVLPRTGHERMGAEFDTQVKALAKEHNRSYQSVSSAYTSKGSSFGAESVSLIKPLRVGLLSGQGTAVNNVGEIWHFFDETINYPLEIIEKQNFKTSQLDKFDVLILPSGQYADLFSESSSEMIKTWIRGGGKLILMENAVSQAAEKKMFSIAKKEEATEEKSDSVDLIKYADRETTFVGTSNQGSIIRVKMDNSHPLAFGYPEIYYSLKTNEQLYKYLPEGWNVGIARKNPIVNGFVGNKLKARMEDFLVFGAEDMGGGQVIYFCDNPLFRSFWENGKLLFANAVFMTGR